MTRQQENLLQNTPLFTIQYDDDTVGVIPHFSSKKVDINMEAISLGANFLECHLFEAMRASAMVG